jgi:EmrB/QacA subfamily drug resistance transporter
MGTAPAAQTHRSAQEHAATFSNKQRTIAVIVAALAFVMDLLDNTIVNVAIPAIQSNLHISYAAIQWLAAGYALTFALLLITGGRMGDVFGYKKLFLGGVIGFMAASLLCGIAWDDTVLIVARLLQGAAAAMMAPQVMSIIQIMYKPAERIAVNGIFGALGGLAATLGPVIGGLLIKANIAGLDWRPIFLINIPVGLFALVMGLKYLPDGKSPHPLKLDIKGTLLVMLALGLFIFPLIQGRELDWPWWSFAMIAASVPLFLIFAHWQRRRLRVDGSPLVMPGLFKHRSFSFGVIVNILVAAIMGCFSLTFTLLLQIGLGYSAIHAALTGLFMAIGISFTMGALGKTLVPKLGRYAVTLGGSLMAIGTIMAGWAATHFGERMTTWDIAPALLVIGVGMGMIFSSLMAIILSNVDPRDAGSASGTTSAIQQLGAAVGVAVIGVVFFGQIATAAPVSFNTKAEPSLRQSLASQNIPADEQDTIVNAVRNCFADRAAQKDANVTPPSCALAPITQAKPGVAAAIGKAAKQAVAATFVEAYRWGVALQLALASVLIAVTFFLPRRISLEAFEHQGAL